MPIRAGTDAALTAISEQFAAPMVVTRTFSTEETMADNSGGIGIMGVLLGALIVIVVGGGLLFATGNLGSKSSTIKVELPKPTTTR